MSAATSRPFGLLLVASVYLFSLLLAASSYGDPFPFMGGFYGDRAGHLFVLADSLLSLYLAIGIIKGQRLTVWLLIAYNLLDIVNALVNLSLLSAADYEEVAGVPVSQDALTFNTLAAAAFLVLITLYVFRKRRYFTNTSPYLF